MFCAHDQTEFDELHPHGPGLDIEAASAALDEHAPRPPIQRATSTRVWEWNAP